MFVCVCTADLLLLLDGDLPLLHNSEQLRDPQLEAPICGGGLGGAGGDLRLDLCYLGLSRGTRGFIISACHIK